MKSVVFVILVALCTCAYADDVSVLRQRLIQSLLPADPAAQKQIVSEANRVAATLNAASTWNDIDFSDTSRTYWKAEQHMNRVLLMSRAYAIDHDAELLAKVNRALDYWLEHDHQNPNWWHNQIGIPQLVGQSVLLLQPHVNAAQTSKAVEILKRANWHKWTGQNLVWGVTIQISRGLIENDVDAITAAYGRMYREVLITQAEGIQPDYSFHQHGDQFYSGGYGMAFAQDVSRYVALSWGTRWQIPHDKLAIFQGYLLDGEQWLMHKARFDYSAIGREITRKGKTAVPRSWASGPITPIGAAYGMLNSISLLEQQPMPRRDELKRFLAHLSGGSAEPLAGNRQFWCSDYMAHHEPGWFASVRMFSTRLLNTEIVNDEGKKSRHLADGCNFIYVNGDEYLDIFPAWDWDKIPGTTAEQALDLRRGIGIRGESSFVGGVSDGQFGLAAMHLMRGKLDAHKAWFFFDEGFLCFGAGISDTSNQEVVTTINQSHLVGKVEHGDGWIHHANIGYLLGDQKPSFSTETQSGNWRDIGMSADLNVSEKVFKLWIDHGIKPSNAQYVYSVLPATSIDQTKATAAHWPSRVVVNTSDVQAAVHEKTGAIACVFAKAGSVNSLSIDVDQPCLVLIHDGKLAVANPENKALTVNIHVRDRSYQIDLPDGAMAGSSVSVPLK